MNPQLEYIARNLGHAGPLVSNQHPLVARLARSIVEDLQILYTQEVLPGLMEEKTKLHQQIAAESKSRMEKEGPLLWEEFHRHTLETPSPENDSRWLRSFANKLPCGECKKHFAGLSGLVPQPGIEPVPIEGDYFTWGVEIHNRVNDSIGKPRMSAEDARARWSK